MHEVAGPNGVTDRGISWIGIPIRVRHGIEVIEIAEELIEAVDAREIFERWFLPNCPVV